MGAITDYYDSGEAAVLALQAGVDMILMPMDLQAAFNGVKAAVEAGTLTEARIDESVTRISHRQIRLRDSEALRLIRIYPTSKDAVGADISSAPHGETGGLP